MDERTKLETPRLLYLIFSTAPFSRNSYAPHVLPTPIKYEEIKNTETYKGGRHPPG